VIVVAVELQDTCPCFFAEAVDNLLHSIAPEGLAELDQESVMADLPLRTNLPYYVTQQINEFYSSHVFPLEELATGVVARNHYEIIASNTPFVLPSAKVWMKHLRVLWKGPWRPAHFWATLNHIADQLQQGDGGRSVPLMATMHVYRSLKDERDNNAVAHVSWLEDSHPLCDELKATTNWPKAAHWSRFRFNGTAALDTLPESYAKEEFSDEIYLAKVERLWEQLDKLYSDVATALDKDLRLSDTQLRNLERTFRDLDDSCNRIGVPSPQYRVLDQLLQQYTFVLSGIFTWAKGKEGVPDIRRQRWLQQDLELAAGLFRAFQPIARVLGGG
jgi:hypothetical protein